MTGRQIYLWISTFYCFMLIAMAGQAQEHPISFEKLTTEEGLSQNDVNAIFQDSRGFMWFGTNDGLNKYDGYNFTVYKPNGEGPNQISSNLIFTIAEDKEQRLWIGTTGKGVSLFDPQKETFTNFRNDPNDPKSLRNNHIPHLLVDRHNRLWVGTTDGLDLMYLNNVSEGFIHLNLNTDNSSNNGTTNFIDVIYEDLKGNILVGTNTGAYKVILPEHSRTLGDNYLEVILENNVGTVRSFQEDSYGNLIIGTNNGLFYQVENQDFVRIANGSHYSIVIDNDNNIWSGTGNGLQLFKDKGRGNTPELSQVFQSDLYSRNSLSKNNIKTVYKSDKDLIWIGTNGGGVNKVNLNQKPFFHYKKTLDPKSLSYNKIRSIYEDSHGTIWVGTEGGGLNSLHSSIVDQSFNAFTKLENPERVFAIEEIKKGNRSYLLIGGESTPGLYYFDITSNPRSISNLNPTPIPEINFSVFSLLKDQKDDLWFGTYGNGLFRWKKEDIIDRNSFDNFIHNPLDSSSIPNDIIRNIIEDSKGNLWIGTGNGLSKLSYQEALKEQPKFINYQFDSNDSTSISHSYILAIHEDRAGQIWIGTFGGGLNKLIPGNEIQNTQFKRYSSADGLPNDVIKSIVEGDDGHLWITTNRGLSRFDPQDETFTNFDVSDGLQSNEFSELASYRIRNGTVFLGGVNGFNVFDPNEITLSQDLPKVAITELSILNQPIEVGESKHGRVILEKEIFALDELKLKYHENSFSLEFAALHYAAPNKNQYAYQLEGFDKDWIYNHSSKRFATYTNLNPGKYTFHLKASNNDGIWGEPIKLSITVIPPFWRTWYAYVFYVCCLLFLLWLFRRYTLIGIGEKHKLMIEHLEKEKSQELNQMKLKFFTNISHELRTPLTLIIGPLENLLKQKQGLNYQEAQQEFQLMYKNSKYLLRLVNQLLDYRKLDQGKMKLSVQNGDIIRFINESSDPFQFLANKKRINFHVESYQERVFLWFDSDVLEKVLYNLLSNAFKFTPDQGTIIIKLDKETGPKRELGKKGNPKSYFSIVVQDSGPGIPPKFKDKVFNRFYKVPSQNKRNQSGAGIGLAFTKSLVELHHGIIQIMSEPSQGSSFKILLPFDKEIYAKEEIRKTITAFRNPIEENSNSPLTLEENQLNLSLKSEDAQLIALQNRDKPLLLIIDDHQDLRSYINRSFSQEYRVIEAADGQEGLQKTIEYMPDLVISDITMPYLDGINLCKQLKAEDQTSHIPIVLLTAKASQETELEALQTGADAYVRKPFNMDLLKTKVLNILKIRKELQKRFRKEVFLEPSEITVTTLDESFLKQAMEVVEEHMSDTEFSVEEMVKKMAVSRSKLYLKLKALTGQSTSEFIRTIRLKRAVQLFEQSDYSVKEIMYMTGFNTSSYFSKCFKKQFGVVPSDYVRNKGKLNQKQEPKIS